MAEITVNSWEECKDALKECVAFRDRLRSEKQTYVSPLLFRGQGNAKWRLSTTLERFVEGNVRVDEYYRAVGAAQPQIQAFTQSEWDVPSFPEIQTWLDGVDFFPTTSLPAYEFLVYLRHHGFPSPLLDWTRSPYVGAFFAFERASETTEYVSIYVYLEYAGEGKSHVGKAPLICGLGPYVKTHRRHFLQQSEYTVCVVSEGDEHRFGSHESVIGEGGEDQDLVWKILVPSRERVTALRELDSMNINALSLFGSEESLMATVAMREFHLCE